MKLTKSQLKQIVEEELAQSYGFKTETAAETFKRVCEQKQTKRDGQPVNELFGVDVQHGDTHVKIQPIGKWSALVGINATVCWTALNISALNAGAVTGTAFFLSTSAVPLMIAGYFGWKILKTKLAKIMPGWMKSAFNIFSREGGDPLEDAQQIIQKSIKKMVLDTELSQEQAETLMSIINKEVHEDEKCRGLTKRMLAAVKENSHELAALTDELDNAVAAVHERLKGELEDLIKYHSPIPLPAAEDPPSNPADLKLTKSQLKEVVKEELVKYRKNQN